MEDAVKTFVSTTFKYNFKSPQARKIRLPELDRDQFKEKTKTPTNSELAPLKRGLPQPIPLKDSFTSPTHYNTVQHGNLRKWIRDNNVERIIGRNSQIIDPRKDEGDLHLDERKEISLSLTNLRKKFDEIREVATRKESEIGSMREMIEKMREEAMLIHSKVDSVKKQHVDLQQEYKQQKQKHEEAELMKDSYEHMYTRMRHDKLIYQTKATHVEEILEFRNGELDLVVDQAKKAEQSQIQSKVYLNTLISSVELEKKKREESLVVFKNAIRNRQDAERQREERIKRTQQIAETAAQEQGSSNEKKWRKLMLVHRFLNQFLKEKMEREMNKYRAVEQAYQKIKAQTGLSDAREIVSRFVNREQTYSELLISIADYERKIESHKKENEDLNSKISLLRAKLMQPVMGKTMIGTFMIKEDIQEMEKELQAQTQHYKNYRLVNDKLYSWSVKMLKRFDKLQSKYSGNYYEQYKRENVVEPFSIVIAKFKEYINSIPLEEAEQLLEEIERTKITEEIREEEYLLKNNRVKPMANLVHVTAQEQPLMERKDTHETLSTNRSTSNFGSPEKFQEQQQAEEDEINFEEETAELDNLRKNLQKTRKDQ